MLRRFLRNWLRNLLYGWGESMNLRFFNAKILKTKEDHTFVITEGELWVENDTIVYIGDGTDTEDVCARLPMGMIVWDREIDVQGNLLMPGFKNAHTHSAMTFLRSYADDLPLQEWLTKQVFPKEAQLKEEDVYLLSVLGIMEYVTSGITSNFDMYFFPRMIAKAASDCGFRTVQVGNMNDFTGSVEQMEEDYHYINELSPLTSFVPGFHAEYTTSLDKMQQIADLSHKLSAPVFMHNAETMREVEECRGRYGCTPTQIMERIGMFELGGGGYHCIYLTEEDIEIFKKHKLSIVTNPASNLKLASGIAPLKRYVDEKLNVAIGTDGPASNNCLDMFREMFLAAGLAKVREADAACIGADEILYMATAGGAGAMGLGDCDCLAPGKKADLILIDLKQPNMQPENNIVKNLVYSGSKQNVAMTVVNGRILYEKQQFFLGIDPTEVYQRANKIIQGMH